MACFHESRILGIAINYAITHLVIFLLLLMIDTDMFSCLFDRENSGYRIVSAQGVLNIVRSHGGFSW